MPIGDKVEIGDIDSKDFKPHLKLNRWDGECFIKVALQTTEKQLPRIEGDKIYWDGKEIASEFLPKQNGYKFNIILKEKPATNVFLLDFEAQGLNFYYQPELTAEEIAEGCIRPENVVGSYAVYHATRANMHASKVDAEKYKVGKAFHWYRPLIWDSSNPRVEVWGELNVNVQLGIRTVTIPQSFLDNAVYPVTIDDDFGFTVQGGSNTTSTTDLIKGYKATPAGAGTADSITFWLVSGANDDGPRKLGLYRMSDGVFIEGTAEYSGETPNDWVSHDLETSPSITAVEYAIVHWAEEFALVFDTVTDAGVDKSVLPYPAAWPDPITWTDSSTNRKISIYCTYTPAGAPAGVGAIYQRRNSFGLNILTTGGR